MSTTTVPAEATARTYQIFANTDYGGQGDGIPSQKGTVAQCQPICDSTPNCVSVAFRKSDSTCFFKSGNVTTPNYNTDVDYYYSGNAPPGGPATAPV